MQIIATEIKGLGFVLETSEKVNGQIQKVTVTGDKEAYKLAYFWNRLYVTEKMCSFFKQRAKAYQIAGLDQEAFKALGLHDILMACKITSLEAIKAVVLDNEKTIRYIAPSETSSQYHYYKNTICSIIEFCRDKQPVTA